MAVFIAVNGLNCQTCVDSHKRIRGCNGYKQPKNICGVKVDKCPIKIVPEIYFEYITAHNNYEKNILPYSGGYMDQPAKYIDVMNVVTKEITKCRTKK